MLYKPLRFFMVVGTVILVPGLVLGARFLTYYLTGGGSGHIQSLIVAAILIVTAVVVYAAGLLSDLIAANRLLLEEIRTRQLRAEISSGAWLVSPDDEARRSEPEHGRGCKQRSGQAS